MASTPIILIKSSFLCLFILVAVIDNSLLCYAMYSNAKLRTIPNYLVLNLAVSDLLFASTCITAALVTTIHDGWALGHVACQISGTLVTLLALVSIWTLAIISINRYFAIAKSNRYKVVFSRKRNFISIASTWIVSTIVSLMPHFGWGVILPGDNLCIIDLQAGLSYGIVISSFAYFIPLVIIAVLYTCIYFELKKHNKETRRALAGSSLRREYMEKEMQRQLTPGMLTRFKQMFGYSFDQSAGKDDEVFESPTAFTSNCGLEPIGIKPDNNVLRAISSEINGFNSDEVTSDDEDIKRCDSDCNSANVTPEISERISTIRNSQTITSPTPLSSNGIPHRNNAIESSKHRLRISELSSRGSLTPSMTSSLPSPSSSRRPSSTPHALSKDNTTASDVKSKRSKKNQRNRNYAREARITRMLFVIVLAFFICWTPIAVGSTLYALEVRPDNFELVSFGVTVASLSSALNPIICGYMSSTFRKAFREIFQSIRETLCCCWNNEKDVNNEAPEANEGKK